MLVNQQKTRSSGTIYTFTHGQQPPGATNNDETVQQAFQNQLQRVHQSPKIETEKTLGHLDPHTTLPVPERANTQDRLLKERRYIENGIAKRTTIGQPLLHERMFTNEKNSGKQTMYSNNLVEPSTHSHTQGVSFIYCF